MTKMMKTTATLNDELYGRFEGHLKDLGVRRDSYLNRMLGWEIDKIESLPTNSEEAAALLRLSRRVSAAKQRKVSFRLEEALVRRLNEVCEAKGIPRDLFLEVFLGHAAESLGQALVLFDNPTFNAGDDPYGRLSVSDEEARSILSGLPGVAIGGEGADDEEN